jgi:hypothetical protein
MGGNVSRLQDFWDFLLDNESIRRKAMKEKDEYFETLLERAAIRAAVDSMHRSAERMATICGDLKTLTEQANKPYLGSREEKLEGEYFSDRIEEREEREPADD